MDPGRPGARTAVPAGRRRGAGRHPDVGGAGGAAAAPRTAPRRCDHRRRPQGCDRAHRPLRPRARPPGQGDRRAGRSVRPRPGRGAGVARARPPHPRAAQGGRDDPTGADPRNPGNGAGRRPGGGDISDAGADRGGDREDARRRRTGKDGERGGRGRPCATGPVFPRHAPSFPDPGRPARRTRPAAPRRAGAPGDRRTRPGYRPRGRGVGREEHRVARMKRLRGAGAALAAAGVVLGCRDRAEAVQRQSALRELVHQRMPALEQVTGLKFKRDPAVAPRSRNQVRDYIVHKFNEDLPPAELAGLQATLVQTLVMMPEQRLEQLPSFWEARLATMAQQRRMPAFAHAPRWLRETLIFPYLAGADFVRWFDTTHPGRQPYGAAMPVSTEQILHPDRYAAGDTPLELAFVAPSPDTVRYEDDLGEFEIRLLFAQLLDDSTEDQAAWLAGGWGGDRYRILGPAFEALVWYSAWDNSAAAARFEKGLERAWARRRSDAAAARRWEIKRLTIDGRSLVRLIDAPVGWAGWRSVPQIMIAKSR